jgi:hypothetical protein
MSIQFVHVPTAMPPTTPLPGHVDLDVELRSTAGPVDAMITVALSDASGVSFESPTGLRKSIDQPIHIPGDDSARVRIPLDLVGDPNSTVMITNLTVSVSSVAAPVEVPLGIIQ